MTEPYGLTIFCDDIRDEVSGKKTYVGAYSGEMIIKGPFPTVVPSFALAITYLEPLAAPVEPVNIKVFGPNDAGEEAIVDFDLPANRPARPPESEGDSLARFRAAIVHLKISPLLLKNEGHFKVRAYWNDKEIRLGSLRVRLAKADEMNKFAGENEIVPHERSPRSV